MPVTLTPSAFEYVKYDPGDIVRIAERLASEVGLGDEAIEIEVDDSTPLPRVRVDSLGVAIRLFVEGGAFEDPTAPLQLSERLTAETIGRLLLKVVDRRSERFSGAPADEDLTLQQSTAWDAYCLGRLQRLGYDVRQPRRRYHFRTRHGFNDVADAAFDRLWAADAAGWADIETACAQTQAVKRPA